MEDSSVLQRIVLVLIHAVNLLFLFGIVAACAAPFQSSEGKMFSVAGGEALLAKKTVLTFTFTSVGLWLLSWLVR